MKYFITIDELPVLRWDKLIKGEGLKHLLVKIRELKPNEEKELERVWVDMNNDFFKRFGMNKKFMLMFDMKIKIGRLKLKRLLEDDDTILNQIRREEIILEKMEANENVGLNVFEAKLLIEKSMKCYIPIKELSVAEFYTYLKNIENGKQ